MWISVCPTQDGDQGSSSSGRCIYEADRTPALQTFVYFGDCIRQDRDLPICCPGMYTGAPRGEIYGLFYLYEYKVQIMYATHGTEGLLCISVHVGVMVRSVAATRPADLNCASVIYFIIV